MKKRLVIKLGGSSLHNEVTLKELAALVTSYRKRRYDVVLVHGGGPAINQELTKRGIEWKFIDGQRQTTPEMISVIEEVLGNTINSMLVQSLLASKIPVMGLSGASDGILRCVQANQELMQVGLVEQVDVTSIESVLSSYRSPVPVIAPIGFGHLDQRYNVNADWAAARIAIALNAKKLIFLTDQNGVLDEDKQLIRRATPSMMHRLIDEGVVSGGMSTKTRAMIAALREGVRKVRVINAACASQLILDKNMGTLLMEPQTLTKKDVMHGYAS